MRCDWGYRSPKRFPRQHESCCVESTSVSTQENQCHIVSPTAEDISHIVRLIESDPQHLLSRTPEEVLSIGLENWRVAKVNNTPIGCGCIEKYNMRIAEVRSFIVLPEYRHLGLGSQILTELLSLADPGQMVFVVTSKPTFFHHHAFGFFSKEKYILFHNPRDSHSKEKALKTG